MTKPSPWQYIRSALFVAQIYLAMPIVGLLYAPWALVSRRGAYAACWAYCRWVFWTAEWMVGITREVRGTPPTGEVLVAAKHQSFLDIMMIFSAIPAGTFIMKREILWTPVIGLYAKQLGCIAVARGKRGAAITKMIQDVKSGERDPGQLVIYSQGTRVAPGAKKPYKIGTAVLYEQMDQPCVPVATNVGVFWPRKGIIRHPGKAIVEFMDPIEPGMDKHAFLAELERRVETRSNELMRDAGFDPDAA